jgi:hypothetical protein
MTNLVRKPDSQDRYWEEASSEQFWPGANFDQPTLRGPSGQRTLSQALDEYDAAPPAKRKSLERGIYQEIIRFRSRLARGMDEAERTKLEARIARYSNSLVERRQK